MLILGILGQEFALYRRNRSRPERPDYRLFAPALSLLVAAAAASLADVTRVWSNPQNHWLQGHAVWHLLSAASLYALFLFYARLSRRA